jgi:hypothetical protein
MAGDELRMAYWTSKEEGWLRAESDSLDLVRCLEIVDYG